MFTVIYGIPEGDKEILNFVESQKKEYGILNFLVFMIVVLMFLIYMFK
jgi:predicted nucleic acid-binding Zn ribbon protein